MKRLSVFLLIVCAGCGAQKPNDMQPGALDLSSNAPPCLPAYTLCNGECLDLNLDNANCGACGTACPNGESCIGGFCASCLPPQTVCQPSCVDTTVDANNCGGCGVVCVSPQLCIAGVCTIIGANTGDPCVRNSDCAGTKPTCISKDAHGNVWPGGYCTSDCNPQKNDPNDMTNADCVGGAATCQGAGTTGTCGLLCGVAQPCTRVGYSCFQICEPTILDKCDPTLAGICGMGMTCVRIGDANVGNCEPSCDPFVQNCPQGNGPAACYANTDTGEGACTPNLGGGMDGNPCQVPGSCEAGLGCYMPPNVQPICRPYCGGPNNIACVNGKKCVDLSPTVNLSIVGVCGE